MSEKSMRKEHMTKAQILQTQNPEIFGISPRPGGYLKRLVPARDLDFSADGGPVDSDNDPPCKCKNVSCKASVKSSKGSIHSSIQSTKTKKSNVDPTTRDFRISKALDDSDWNPSEKSDGEEEYRNEVETNDGVIIQDINLLATTITTVMLLASKQNTPSQYLNATEDYLECIKTDDNNTPPNVQGILNKIALEKGTKGVNWVDDAISNTEDGGKKQDGPKKPANVSVITVVKTGKSPSVSSAK